MSGYRKFADRDAENSEPTSTPAKAAKPAKVSTPHFSNFSSFSRDTPANPKFAEDPIWWRDLFEERAAIRQNDGGYTGAEAERLAWDELEGHWHRLCGERISPRLCAGCLRPIDSTQALDLDDGCRAHLACVARYGQRWREAAAIALAGLGLRPPR
jgi:hypothetical protein